MPISVTEMRTSRVSVASVRFLLSYPRAFSASLRYFPHLRIGTLPAPLPERPLPGRTAITARNPEKKAHAANR